MTTPTTGAAYRPAFLPGGDVSLARACAFIDLYTEVLEGLVAAATPEPEPAEVPAGPRTSKMDGVMPKPPAAPITTLSIGRALARPAAAARFAAVILVHDDGTDVTEEEAAEADFPFGPFAEAWFAFQGKCDAMTSAQLGLPLASASRGATAAAAPGGEATATPDSSSRT